MSFNATDFVNDLLKDTKLSDEQKAAVQSALTTSEVASRLEGSALRQSDYSRLSAEAQQKIKAATDYYNELVQWKQTETQRTTTVQPNPAAATPETDYLSKDEFNKELLKVQSGAIGFLSTMNDKSIEFLQDFGKRLDTAAVLKKAQEDGTNFAIAYERFTQPMREEKAKAELEVRIKRERAEAASEALANVALPTAINNTGMAGGNPHVLDRLANKPAEGFGWKAAAAAHTRDILAGTVQHE